VNTKIGNLSNTAKKNPLSGTLFLLILNEGSVRPSFGVNQLPQLHVTHIRERLSHISHRDNLKESTVN
jgi:hypothetical protein